MKKIHKAYQYFYYKIYKSIEYTSESQGVFWSEWKTSFILLVLEIFILLSTINYYTFFSNNIINFDSHNLLIFGVVLFITTINYFIFHYNDKWKDININFDKLPQIKNKQYGIIVWSIILLIVFSLGFSFYCLDLKARENQTGPYSKEYIEQQKIKDSIFNAQYKTNK